MRVLVVQSCLTLCDPTDCSSPGFSVHGVAQARILGWVAIPSSRGSSWPRDGAWVSCIAGRFFTVWRWYVIIRKIQKVWKQKAGDSHIRNILWKTRLARLSNYFDKVDGRKKDFFFFIKEPFIIVLPSWLWEIFQFLYNTKGLIKVKTKN